MGDIKLNLENAKKIDGWMYESELEWIAQEAAQHSEILELGAFLGRTTRAICDNSSAHVTVVDIWGNTTGNLSLNVSSWDEIYDKFRLNLDDIDPHRIEVLRLMTASAINLLDKRGRKFDFIFIDADHRYTTVWSDIIGCQRLLTPGGVLSGHDFNWEGVERAVKELLPNYKLAGNVWYVK